MKTCLKKVLCLLFAFTVTVQIYNPETTVSFAANDTASAASSRSSVNKNVNPLSQEAVELLKKNGFVTSGASNALIQMIQSPELSKQVYQFTLSDETLPEIAGTEKKQRNEISPVGSAELGQEGTSYTLRWKFRIDENYPAHEAFCLLFQVKTFGVNPTFVYRTTDRELKFMYCNENNVREDIATVPLESVRGKWLDAFVSYEMKDAGNINMLLKTLDGTILMEYSGVKDIYMPNNQATRPKWGIYRAVSGNMPLAKLQFSDFSMQQGFQTLSDASQNPQSSLPPAAMPPSDLSNTQPENQETASIGNQSRRLHAASNNMRENNKSTIQHLEKIPGDSNTNTQITSLIPLNLTADTENEHQGLVAYNQNPFISIAQFIFKFLEALLQLLK